MNKQFEMEDTRPKSVYMEQLKAMLKRNLLLKKREHRKSCAEIIFPLYTMCLLILIKYLMPNPTFPEITTPRGEAELFEYFQHFQNHTVAVVPNTTDTLEFLSEVNKLWLKTQERQDRNKQPINWLVFPNRSELLRAYWLEPKQIPIAVIFEEPGPINGKLKYEIKSNPSYDETPATTVLYSSPASCRQSASHWTDVFPIESGDSCPVNEYYYSGFVALQALLDYTKIKIDSGREDIKIPQISLEMFPKEAYTADWMVLIRIIIPLYMVTSLSQFITYLLILIVGEKENKIKEGMKMMGLRDSVFWLSWFIVYAIFVSIFSIVSCILLFTLGVFPNSNFILIFLLVILFSFSIIMFGFMLTPFFDKSRTAGILGNFILVFTSLFYFVDVFFDTSNPTLFWTMSLISSSGFALALDKVLVLELAGQGITFGNLWEGEGISFGGSLIMMSLDTVLYGLLAYYLDSVIPSETGIRRNPLFCFYPSFWCSKKPVKDYPIANGGSVASLNTGEDGNVDVEPVSREMKGREAIKITDLYKSFTSCRKPEIKAINGINLTIYEGQITAILGHNGAGKTTLFNILTGLTSPSSGTAYIFGYDVRDSFDMDEIRRMTGVCPQHDILFDKLTPKEHLEFFAALRGIPEKTRELEVMKILRDIDLSDKANATARHLSGGQKRKLSIAIALIGDPKIIILDEPTAGVDPCSRRHMWSFLQNRRHGKVILLTTHFMDEADILADRKAVVSKGSIRCCGSSLFLKNKFGIGYHLTLVLDGVAKEHQIAKLVTSHVAKAEKARRHGRELSFILPHNAVNSFAPLFTAIEQEINNQNGKLGISSYGVSMTTLEEVFLHLERDEEELEEEQQVDELSKKVVRGRTLSRSLSLQSKSTSYQSLQNEGNNVGNIETESDPSTLQTLFALLHLRVIRIFRDIQKLFFIVFLPILLALLGLYSYENQTFEPRQQTLALNGTTYPDVAVAIHNGSEKNLDAFLDELMYSGPRQIDEYNGNFSLLLEMKPHMAALNINVFNYPEYSMTVIYNDTFQHGLPIVINFISNTVYRLMTPDRIRTGLWEPIEVNTQPLQQTAQIEGFNFAVFSSSTFMGMIFVLVPASLSIDMIHDREIKAKNQLRVNGLSFSLYFVTYLFVMMGLMFVICAALFLIVALFQIPTLNSWPALLTLGVLIFLYCPCSILFNICVGYAFDKTESAQAIIPNITPGLGVIPFYLIMFLDLMRIGGKVSFIIHTIFSLLDTMYMPFAIIYYVQRVFIMCKHNYACGELTISDYLTNEIIIIFVGIFVSMPFWFFVLVVLDIKKSGGKIGDTFRTFFSKKDTPDIVDDISEMSDIGENEDNDVKAERLKVKNLMHTTTETPPVVIVQNLHKDYKKHSQGCECCNKREKEVCVSKTAVKSLCLSVDAGEVFGLLGHNGAGKTTTMKIITGEEAPTRGRVQICGKSITSNMNDVFHMLGYCPQHDALWKNITVREHLECYAAIRGVPRSKISKVVNLYLTGLQIHEHADKQTQQCSGGTKRKLSFALAMIGNPKIVMLDEPSTGMDPKSKRFLWDTIIASFQGSRGAILTTHSMEEADALCSRVGIMVKGELRCLGPTQHLKNKYGAGYTLEIKLKGGDSTPTSTTGDKGNELTEFVANLFQDANLLESFADRLVFSVPQSSVPSLAKCFASLEKAKIDLDIAEYSFSQTTLEQVFLKFAQYDEANSE